jgi:CBS domain-containing protein
VIAGLGAGMLSALLTLAVYTFEDLFKRLPIHWMWWPAIGGLAIGIGGVICPRALGVGYDTIGTILHGGLATKAVLVLVVVKSAIWSISLGSGTSGGVLAPLLMMGGALGGLEGLVFPDQGVGFWPLIGMGAILGGTMRSPLTGMIFAVELTHDMNMLLPLAIAVSVAHTFTVLTLRRSILTEKVARRGFHVSREYAIDELEILFVRDVMNSGPRTLPLAASLREVMPMLDDGDDDKSQHLYPVLDDDARLVAAVTHTELRGWASLDDNLDRPLSAFSLARPHVVFTNETLRIAVHRMAEHEVTRLVAVNPADSTRLVGTIALHDLLIARTRSLEAEQRRERVLPWQYFVPPWLRNLVPLAKGQASDQR